jgi:hypothetical protein
MQRWRRFRRQRQEALQLASAPHRAWTLTLLEAHASVLERRLRQPHLRALADRVVELDASLEAFADDGSWAAPARTELLLDRVLAATTTFFDDERALAQGFADFAAAVGRAGSAFAERRLMIEHLHATVPNARERDADVAALDRHLALDALRERSAAAVLRASATVEVGLRVWARAVAATPHQRARAATRLGRRGARRGAGQRRPRLDHAALAGAPGRARGRGRRRRGEPPDRPGPAPSGATRSPPSRPPRSTATSTPGCRRAPSRCWCCARRRAGARACCSGCSRRASTIDPTSWSGASRSTWPAGASPPPS